MAMHSSLSARVKRSVVAPLVLAVVVTAAVAVNRTRQIQQSSILERNRAYARSLAQLGAALPDGALCRTAPSGSRILHVEAADLSLICDSDLSARLAARPSLGGELARAVRDGRTDLVVPAPASGEPVVMAIAGVPGTTQALIVLTPVLVPGVTSIFGWQAVVVFMLVTLAWLGANRAGRHVSASLQILQRSLRQSSERAPLPEFASLQGQIESRLDELTRLTDAALEQRDELNFILDSMPEAVLIFDRERRLLRYNESARRLLELRSTEAVGQVIESVIRHNGLIRFVDTVLLSRDAAYREDTLEWNNRTVHAVSGVQVEWAGLHKAIVVLSDLTASRRLEQIKSDFVANASHELQTPLTAIRGYSETLLDGAHDDASVRLKFLDSIHRHAVRLEALVKDLLALARIEREEGSIERTMQQVYPIAEAVLSLVAARTAETGAQLQLDIDRNLHASLNSRLCEQALLNLVENALRYSPRGSTVTVAAQSEGRHLILEVVDNGPGIAAEHLPRLFERFYRVDPARSRQLGGTGLGLAIVKHVALAHGGTVDVRSEPGKGSRFRLILPREA